MQQPFLNRCEVVDLIKYQWLIVLSKIFFFIQTYIKKFLEF